MKTLLIKYLPSGKQSNTQKLLDLFLTEIKNENLEVVDLLSEKVPIFNLDSMAAYYKRNYNGQKLDPKESVFLADNDRLIKQFKSADVITIACPMHNFGLPAAVKAYMDAIIFKGETFDYNKKMMSGRKALVLFTSGGSYNDKFVNLEYPNWDTLTMAVKINFNFMGFDNIEVIGSSLRENEDQKLADAKIKIKNLVANYYN
jgi:FMN-dependent NADH-azoreductase